MPEINLCFVNNSSDVTDSKIVIYQKNILATAGELVVAWRVITTGNGDKSRFTFSFPVAIGAVDEYGNVMPKIFASDGQRFDVVSTPLGNQLQLSAQAVENKSAIELNNELPVGAISAKVYRTGASLLAEKAGIGPGQKAMFQFFPEIYIAVITGMDVRQNEMIPVEIVSNNSTMISLMGISGADIVMTGGGPPVSATPYLFTLQNVMYS